MRHKMMLIVLYSALSPLFLLGARANHKRPAVSVDRNATFYSSGLRISAWTYLPKKKGKVPVIVMAPGFSGTKECNYQFYAERFANAGFGVVLFDYPNFGSSEIRIAQEADPEVQIQAYRDAITYALTLPAIDPARVGIWGGSYSGGHVLMVAALDDRVKCFVAMTPFVSGSFYQRVMPEDQMSFLSGLFAKDSIGRSQGDTPMLIPVAAEPDAFCAIGSPNALAFIRSFQGYARTYRNEITLKSLALQLQYDPINFIDRIPAIPKLFIVARGDELIPEELVLKAFELASEPKSMKHIDGNHFSPYLEELEHASTMAIKWFSKQFQRKKK